MLVLQCLSLTLVIFLFLCFQSITPSPEQDVRVWLAVHEDGLSVLELSSVVRICEPQTHVLVQHPSFSFGFWGYNGEWGIMRDSVTGVHGRLAVFYKCIRAVNLISKMCVSRSYWCLIPTRMWWRLEAANKTLCWWWDRTWVATPPKTKLQWNICLPWMLPRLATLPDPFTQIFHL